MKISVHPRTVPALCPDGVKLDTDAPYLERHQEGHQEGHDAAHNHLDGEDQL